MKKILLYTCLLAALAGGVTLIGVNVYNLPQVVAQEEVEIPFLDDWAGSAHADASAEAFTHWDEESPPEIPERCAKCHSTPGYLDFLGADGSEAGVVDAPAPVGTVITCVACHNEVTLTLDSVTFPSGVEVTGLGDEARCMQCHQGRASTQTVDKSIEEAGLTDMDAVSEDLGFTNIHYFAAAATQAGGTAMGGYQYEGKPYDARFAHVEQFNTCIGCHNSHTLELNLDACSDCHAGVLSKEDLRDIRMPGSLVDYDGDGDLEEGVYYEIEGLRDMLYQAIQAYASEVSGVDIAYEAHTYPYFFIDTNGNGKADADEAAFPNKYNAWTGRLAKAAYNYQTSVKDPGAYAHGGKYIIQLLYDSIEDLNQALSRPVDLSKAHRVDHGHFAGSEEAFRHWDEDGAVPGSCSKCHSAEGLPLFLKEGVTISQSPSNGLLCSTCHESIGKNQSPIYTVEQVEFPSGLVVTADESDPVSLLCMNCHQGRESTVSVNEAIEGLEPDAVSEKLRFLNVHYFAAGATRYGTQAKGAYEYDGQSYNGFFPHKEDGVQGCNDCHDQHELEIQPDTCAQCHSNVNTREDMTAIRESTVDYDGDGDASEGMAGEIATMHESLYAAIQQYAADTVGTDIVYESHSYPYFFTDTNGNGVADPDEANFGNRYATWTPRLLQAAYNYQFVAKAPGMYAHNPYYVLQILYDSLADLGADVSGMTRPEVQ